MNSTPPDVIEFMEQCFRRSLGVRAVGRLTGVSKTTVAKYVRLLGPFNCECGKPLLHRGWCRVRVRKSASRIAFLNRAFGTHLPKARSEDILMADAVVRTIENKRKAKTQMRDREWLREALELIDFCERLGESDLVAAESVDVRTKQRVSYLRRRFIGRKKYEGRTCRVCGENLRGPETQTIHRRCQTAAAKTTNQRIMPMQGGGKWSPA